MKQHRPGKLFFLIVMFLWMLAARAAMAVPVVRQDAVVNAASFAPGVNALAPGTVVTIFGTGLNNGSVIPNPSFGSNGRLLTTLGGASVTFNGFSAPMYASTPGQLNAQIPLELEGATSASVVVTVNGQASVPVTVAIAPTSPGIYVINGNGQGAIQIANTNLIAASPGSFSGAQSRAANPGEFITIYTTGMGNVTNPPATGATASGQPTLTLPQVMIGGVQANVIFAGLAPGFVGLYQVNAQVPQGASGGGFAQVVLSIGGKQSNSVGMAVSGNGNGGSGAPCLGFSVQGTATSLTGTIPGNCLQALGNSATGGVTVSLTGVTNGNQTVYSGNLNGNGTVMCATGSAGNWTANLSLTLTANPAVTSLTANGGILSGTFSTSSASANFCGSIQNLGGITAAQTLTGSVLAGGATTVNIGGPFGFPPVVMRGNAQSINGPLSGVTIAGALFGNYSANGSLSISTTGATSGSQTVYTGTGAGGGNVQQCPGGPGVWTATLSSFTATVNPTVPSLAASGGTVSGNWSASLSATVCGSNRAQNISGSVSGIVSPGGSVTLTLAVGGDNGGGNEEPVVLTGTASSISGTVPGVQLLDDPTATGNLAVSATGVSSSSQTVYTGGGSGSGTVSCQNFTGSNTTGNWSISVTATITVSPSVPSLATSGGSLSGTAITGFSGTVCGMSVSDDGDDSVSGSVAPGGAVTLSI